MKKYILNASQPRLRIPSHTGSCCLLLVLLALCGNAQSATTTFEPDATFNDPGGTVLDTGYELWATDIRGRPEPTDLQMNNGTSRMSDLAVSTDSPSRLSFFYILGTAVIIALLVEIFSKKDI